MESTLYLLSENDGVISYNFDEIDFIIKNSSAIAYGMGTNVNDDGVKIIEHILREFDGALILDAGGIRCLSQIDENAIKNKRASLVITPHIGEIKAIYKEYKNPLDAINLAKKIDATVLLKGPTTVITNGHNTYFVTRGCSGMATGGSGDVLSGIICALCGYIKDPLKASALGAYINGMAGEMAMEDLCDISMSAYDTALNVARAISKIKK
jgi:NAD(P)H-hydrate epimerase